MNFKRIISCIAIWIMFLATVVSYFMFISGEEYGNFELFYWSVVSITFANGFSSNFGFGVNFNGTVYGAGMPASSFVTFIVHKSYNYFYNKYFWDEYDYMLVVVQYAFTSFFLALTGALWTWDQYNEMNKPPPPTPPLPPTIQVDISQNTTYDSGRIKVTKMRDVTVGSNNVKFNFYVHTLTTGGKFTLSKDIKYNASGGTAQLSGETSDIPNVSEVYYYKESNGNNGALKIKTSSDAKIFYEANVTQSGPWTNQATTPPGDAELQGLVNEIKDQVEIKLEKDPRYISALTGNKITVEAVNDTLNPPKYKGFKHPVPNGSTINYISIRNQPISFTPAITENDLQGKRFLFVYYENSDGNYEKPLLICLSDTGGQSSGNKWYQRQIDSGGSGGYTWSEDNSLSAKDPNQINTFSKKLDGIKQLLTNDTGYPVLVDRNDDLPNEQGSENNVNIHIEKKDFGYDSSGSEKTVSDISAGHIKVFLNNNNPKFGFKRYMHKVRGTNANEYRKMSNTGRKFKNNNSDISSISVNGNVNYVYVYYGGAQSNIPLLIAICKDNSSNCTWKYFKNGNPRQPNSTTWSEENSLNNKNPDGYVDDKNHIIVELDKLNDKVIQKTVIHLEKTDTKGVNTSRYTTGQSADKTITVEKNEGSGSSQMVPEGYVMYKHTLGTSTSDPKFKHNGFELNGINPDKGVTAVYAYYRQSPDDSDHEFPLIVCVKIGSNSWSYYQRGNRWTHITDVNLDNQDPENLQPEDLKKLQDKLGEVKGKFEVKLEKSASYGFISQIDVENATVTVDGYKGYKHQKGSGGSSNTFKIEKFRHDGNVVGGFTLPISGVEEANVYYKDDDSELKKPLLLYTKDNNSNPYAIYGKGTRNFQMKWWKIGKPSKDVPTEPQLKRHLEMLLNIQGTFKELVYFDNKEHWSPILMLSFSLGTIYAFYPTISPYSLIDPERAEKIDLWIAVTCAIPNFVLAVMDTLGDRGHGPGARWENDGDVKRECYHYVWIIGGIPYLICLYVFFTTLHFPEGWIGRHVKDNLYVVGFFGVTFNTVQELMESTGFGGGDKQSYDGFVGSISQFSVLLMLITCVSTMFSCDGYLKIRHLIWG